MRRSNQATLLGYNFRVLMLNNWLLLAFPIAVSQLTVFWLAITRRFSLDLPAQSVEMVTPILAAFLGAHLLSAEYRSRIGAILASRPVNIGSIVLIRLAVLLALVWCLAVLSLFAYHLFWQVDFDMVRPLLACLPSTLFLTMLAVSFATLFRNPLAGFSVAALYWALDLAPGPPIQPYLSLKSLTSYYTVQHNTLQQTFLLEWTVSKLLLLIGAVALYLFHRRLLPSIGSPMTKRIRVRAALTVAAMLLLYLISGAALKVGYGYRNMGSLPRGDLAWFRHQMSSFGPLPAAALFGSPFKSFIGDIGNPWRMSGEDAVGMLGDTPHHRSAMRETLQRSPGSVWAPSIAFALTRMELQGESRPETVEAAYRRLRTEYPHGPYVQDYLRLSARAYVDATRPPEARRLYQELLSAVPNTRYASEAYRYLYDSSHDMNNVPEALQWAEKWGAAAPVEERFEALADVMELRKSLGDTAGAKRAAADILKAVDAFNHAVDAGQVELTPAQTITRPQQARRAEREARALL